MRRVDDDERRARLGRRQFLAENPTQNSTGPTDGLADVAGALVGLHASDPATVFLALRARLRDATVADVEKALYDDRSVLKVLAMRRTMFVVPGSSEVRRSDC